MLFLPITVTAALTLFLSLNSLSLGELDTRGCLVCHIFQHVINPIIFNNNCKKEGREGKVSELGLARGLVKPGSRGETGEGGEAGLLAHTQPHPFRPLSGVPRLQTTPPTPWWFPRSVLRKGNREGANPAAQTVSTPPNVPPGRIYLETRLQGRRGSRGLRAEVSGSGTLGAETSRGRAWRESDARGRFPRRAADPGIWPRPGDPLQRGLVLSALPAAAEVRASARRRPLRVCLALCPPSLSPSRPSLGFLNPSSISRRHGHLPRSLGPSPCWGCRSPSLFQLLPCPPQTCVPARSLSRSGSLSRAFVSVSAHPGPHPQLTPPHLCVSVSPGCYRFSLIVPAPLEPPLRPALCPSLSRAFPALAPSAQTRQIPTRCQVTMKTLKTPRLPRRNGVLSPQFHTLSSGESWDTPTRGDRESAAATPLHKGGEDKKNKLWRGWGPGVTFQPSLQLEAATPPG